MSRPAPKFMRSAIVRKVTLRLLLIEVLILVLALVASQLFLLPALKEQARQSAQTSMDHLTAQVESQVNHYASYSQFIIHTDAIRDCIDRYQQDPSNQNYNLLSLALTQQLSSSKAIRGLQLESGDGTVFRSVVNLRDSDFAQLEADWYQSVFEGHRSTAFSTIYDPGLSTPSSSLAYSRTYYISTERYVLTLFFNCSDLTQIVDTASATFDGLVITDFANTPFYEMGDIGNSYDILPMPSGQETEDGYYLTSGIYPAAWQLVGYISTASLMGEYWSIFLSVVALFSVFCLLTIFIAIPIMGHTLSPIRSLSDTMRRVSDGDTTAFAPIESKDEIGDLSRIFNDMLVSLNEHMERQIAFEASEQRMRYNLLLAQIDSHFIGNTMSSINSLARQGRTEDVVAVNTALLKIIQNNLRIRDLDITDTLAQEMEIVEQYWIISKIRQENQAELIWDIPDEVMEFCIPKNIIQPLVENCLFHGLIDEETGAVRGEIRVSAADLGSAVQICVRDNGRGIPPMMLEYLNKPDDTLNYLRERGRHIGIANIKQRLQYFYKQDCMHITCDHGTIVTITIPKEC